LERQGNVQLPGWLQEGWWQDYGGSIDQKEADERNSGPENSL
jgi:hypothetical protein